jgi:hypothetical protein
MPRVTHCICGCSTISSTWRKNMPKDHQKPTDSRRESLLSSTPVLLAALSLLSASLGVSGTTPTEGSDSAIDVEKSKSTNTQLAQANFSKAQMQYTTQSGQKLQSDQQKIQGLQSNQNKLERKAGKGQQEFLQSNQQKIQGGTSGTIKAGAQPPARTRAPDPPPPPPPPPIRKLQ